MTKNYEKILNFDKISESDKYYWGYQYRLSAEILTNMLSQAKVFAKNSKVVEIGCGEGGVLTAFSEKGAVSAVGFDISANRIKIGNLIAEHLNSGVELFEADLLNWQVPEKYQKKFDLAILRDVIEHLDDPREALAKIKEWIKPGGFLYVTFPPYHSPFGGHQQIVMNKPGKIPYIHLLPKKLFFKLIESGRKLDVGEVKRIHRIRMTPKKFISAAKDAGYILDKEEYYLLRPVFKMKFGLPSIKITPFAKLNFIRKYFSLEASYILKVPE